MKKKLRKKISSYIEVLRELQSNGGKISLVAKHPDAAVEGYRGYGPSFYIAPVLLYKYKDVLHGDVLLRTVRCRGWTYDSMAANYRGIEYEATSPTTLKNMPCSAFLIYTNIDIFIKYSVPIINGLEKRAGWVPSKAFVLDRTQNKILLVGSKKWLRNSPLVSAYLLIGRVVKDRYKDIKGLSFDAAFKKLKGEIEESDLLLQGDTAAFKKLFHKDLLHLLMTKSHLSGMCGSKLYKKSTKGIHDRGIGDLSASIFHMLKKADKSKVDIKTATDGELRELYKKSDRWTTYYEYKGTNDVHWDLVKAVAISIQQREKCSKQ